MLKRAIDVIESSEKALEDHEQDVAKFINGDKDALKWLRRSENELSDEEIVEAARKVSDVIRDQVKKARDSVPILISSVKNGGWISEDIRIFLSRD